MKKIVDMLIQLKICAGNISDERENISDDNASPIQEVDVAG